MQVDNLTLVLLFVLTVLLLYSRARPTPNVHPLLLGKQSQVSQVRNPGETGVYRSFATGQGTPLQVRPASSLKTIQDIIPATGHPRCILDTILTDDALTEITRLLPIGLSALFPTQFPTSSTPTSSTGAIITLLPPSPTTSLPLLLLSLASRPSHPLVILPNPIFLTHALTNPPTGRSSKPSLVVVHECIADEVIEQVWEDCGPTTAILLVGDPEKKCNVANAAKSRGMMLHWWEEIWDAAQTASRKGGVEPTDKDEQVQYGDIHSYYYTMKEETPVVIKATHMNITAGIAGLLSLFPADKRPSAAQHDVIASAIRLDTPLGMTIALASIWSGAGFRLLGVSAATWEGVEGEDEVAEIEAMVKADQPRPSILFISSRHHTALLAHLHSTVIQHPFASLAVRHKLSALRAGKVDREGLFENIMWRKARNDVLGGIAGDSLRSIVIVGDAPLPEALTLSHVLLSVPLTRLHASPFSAGPVFVSHFYDVQTHAIPEVWKQLGLGKGDDRVHCGPPASNVEVVLKGPGVEKRGKGRVGETMEGRVWIRGPAVLEIVGDGGDGEGWVDIGEDAKVQTNGTFLVGPLV